MKAVSIRIEACTLKPVEVLCTGLALAAGATSILRALFVTVTAAAIHPFALAGPSPGQVHIGGEEQTINGVAAFPAAEINKVLSTLRSMVELCFFQVHPLLEPLSNSSELAPLIPTKAELAPRGA